MLCKRTHCCLCCTKLANTLKGSVVKSKITKICSAARRLRLCHTPCSDPKTPIRWTLASSSIAMCHWWAANVDAVCRKLGRKIGALRRSFRQLTPFARRSFFITVIQPDLEYAALVSVPCMSATLRNRLLTVWRRAIRCAAGAAYQSDIDPILKENKITDLTNRWIVQYAVFVRRCYRMEAPPAACKKLQVTSHVYQTRGNTSTFRPHRPVCNAGVRSFSNRAPLLWNALSPDVRDASSTTKFKKNLLLFLQNENNYTTLNRLCFENPS